MSAGTISERPAAREELANALTHGVGLLGSVAGAVTLITLAALTRDPWLILGASVYAVSLVVLYGASTMYHAVRHPLWKARLRVADHCAIFGLIAGTYTPFSLGPLRGGWGWTLLGLAWGLAIAGSIAKLFLTGRFDRISTLVYLAMGWMVVVALGPLRNSVSTEALAWLVAGGLSYSVGTLFYLNRRLPYAHAVWHLLVLAGSACHFTAVLHEVLLHLPA